MKKLMLITAILGLVSYTGLANIASLSNSYTNTETAINLDRGEFEAINVNELPEAVTQAIKKDDKNLSIESAESKVLSSGEKVFKVSLKSQDGEEHTKKYYANGQKYKKD